MRLTYRVKLILSSLNKNDCKILRVFKILKLFLLWFPSLFQHIPEKNPRQIGKGRRRISIALFENYQSKQLSPLGFFLQNSVAHWNTSRKYFFGLLRNVKINFETTSDSIWFPHLNKTSPGLFYNCNKSSNAVTSNCDIRDYVMLLAQ